MTSSFGFASVLGLDQRFQIVQAIHPKRAILLDPGIDRAQRFRIEMVDAVSAFTLLPDEVGSSQQAQMLGNRGPGDREGAGNLPGRLGAATEKIEHGATRGIGESLEGGLVRRGICNRTVTHNA